MRSIENERKRKSDAVISFFLKNRKIKIKKITKKLNLSEQAIYNCITQYRKIYRITRNRFLSYEYIEILEDFINEYKTMNLSE